MFDCFLREKKGVVTVFFVAILIAAMSFNTMFLEAARYRSTGSLFSEIEENAAFSALAHYDRDLYENYGLLAVGEDVDADMIRNYMLYNANISGIDGVTNLDVLLNSNLNINLEKLYDLSQSDVFKSQINEFCMMRAPVALVKEWTDFDATITDFLNTTTENIKFLNKLNDIAGKADKVLDMLQAAYDFWTMTGDLIEVVDEYSGKVMEYNAAVDNLRSYKSAFEAKVEAGADVDYEQYDIDVRNLTGEVRSSLVNLSNATNSAKSYLGYWYNDEVGSFKNFEEKYNAMVEAMIETDISEAKESGDNADEIASAMEGSYSQGDEEMEDIIRKVKEDGYAAGKAFSETFVNELIQKLGDYNDKLLDYMVSPENAPNVEAIDLNPNNLLGTIYDSIDTAIANAQEKLETEIDVIESIGAYIEILGQILTLNIDAEDGYDTDISGNTGFLPGWYYGYSGAMCNVYNIHDEEDEALLNTYIAKTKAVADAVGYDTKFLGQSDKESDQTKLSSDIESLKVAITDFNVYVRNLKLDTNLIELIDDLKNVLTQITRLLSCCIAVTLDVGDIIAGAGLSTLVYGKLNPAVYATEMFTNRATEVSEAVRMNGTSMHEYSSDGVFKKASAEYVFTGNTNEISNQKTVFWVIFVLRLLANIPALIKDPALGNAASGIASVPYVGIVLAILMILLIWVMEAYFDMAFMIYGDEGIAFVKTTGYFNFQGQGVREFGNQLKGLSDGNEFLGKQLDSIGASISKKTGISEVKGADFGTYRLKYKDHLFLILLLFTSGDKMYARMADLIQMQMAADTGTEYKLQNMATYLRVDASASYRPLLPIPVISGANGTGLTISRRHYSGY